MRGGSIGILLVGLIVCLSDSGNRFDGEVGLEGWKLMNRISIPLNLFRKYLETLNVPSTKANDGTSS